MIQVAHAGLFETAPWSSRAASSFSIYNSANGWRKKGEHDFASAFLTTSKKKTAIPPSYQIFGVTSYTSERLRICDPVQRTVPNILLLPPVHLQGQKSKKDQGEDGEWLHISLANKTNDHLVCKEMEYRY